MSIKFNLKDEERKAAARVANILSASVLCPLCRKHTFREPICPDCDAEINGPNPRLEKLDQLADHPFYCNYFRQVGRSGLKLITDFIMENRKLSKTEFAQKVNMLFVGSSKPAKHATITELLMVCNQ